MAESLQGRPSTLSLCAPGFGSSGRDMRASFLGISGQLWWKIIASKYSTTVVRKPTLQHFRIRKISQDSDFGEVHMLGKCANPSCSAQLVYLREGKIFMVERPQQLYPAATGRQEKRALPARVEHFWLCGACSAQMTLVYDSTTGIRVIRKDSKQQRAVSSRDKKHPAIPA
jgi:hypothetical protein